MPVYSPIFFWVDTLINGQCIESVKQYSEVCQMYVNCNMDVIRKAGVQYAYGYQDGTIMLNNAVAGNAINSDLLMSPWDSRTIAANQAPET